MASRARRILVVEDSADVAESIRMLLEMWGHEVHVARTGREAIDASGRHHPDVILLDLGLPDMSGYEVARVLRQPAGGGPVLVAVTGFGLEEHRRRSREAGILVHLVKPVDPARLRDLLASLREEGARHASS